MANGQAFDPDQLSAASWFYPLGTTVRVTRVWSGARRSVKVVVTDRGPAFRLVDQGRIIDLSRASFERLAPVAVGLVEVTVETATAQPDQAR